ncbi:hypothetical protein H4R19_001682, partial [Coemansia spiralis]
VTSNVSSNRHCTFTVSIDKETKEYIVICEDLSSNGTFWNTKKIGKNQSVILGHGSLVEIKKGNFLTFLFLSPSHASRGNKDNQINDKYQVTDTELGRGTFAIIRKGYRKDTMAEIAVKVMNKRSFSMNGSSGGGTNYVHEINLLRAIRHPNIVRVYDVSETPENVFIFMPYLKGGDLFDCIIRRHGLPEDEAKYVVYQVLLALRYLHDSNIAHRDLKPENTLMASEDPYTHVMLTDFGMAKAAGNHELMKTMCGTFQYIAPEMLTSRAQPGQALEVGYTTAVDCWSLGVMTYATVSSMLPFSDENGGEALFDQIRFGTITFSDPCWETLSSDCVSFIRCLLCTNPLRRMYAADAFTHPWIAKDEARLAKRYAQGSRAIAEVATPTAVRTPSPATAAAVIAAGSALPDPAKRSPSPAAADAPTAAAPMGPPPKRVRQP